MNPSVGQTATRSKTKSYKLKKIEVITNIFSNKNVIKLKINSRGKMEKFTNEQVLNDILLNKPSGQGRNQKGNYKIY